MHPAETTGSRPVVWCLGGSDCAGGAGIQADLLTCHDLQAHACTLITAVTAQNSRQFLSANPVAATVLESQWQALATDLPPAAIKIGLIGSQEQLDLLSRRLESFRQRTVPVIYDPVMMASVGQSMMPSELNAQLASLYPSLTLITPNRSELQALTGMDAESPEQIMQGAQQLISSGCQAVLVKGGHHDWLPELAVDYFTDGQQAFWMVMPRQTVKHDHGTGCTLASAIAALMAQGYLLPDALVLARSYLQRCLQAGYAAGQGAGPVGHQGWPDAEQGLPTIYPQDPCATVNADLRAVAALPLRRAHRFAGISTPLGLYPVVDSLPWIERLLSWGVKTVQLRIKNPQDPQLETHIIAAIALGRRYQARVFINDYWQLALRHGAYGVHLGQEDLLTADLAALAEANIRLGISTHGFYELALAMTLAPSYLALGHIFPTATKQMASQPQGLQRLARAVALCRDRPTVAIGGISYDRVASVLATGVSSIAMVSAITQAADPEAVTRQLLARIECRADEEVEHA